MNNEKDPPPTGSGPSLNTAPRDLSASRRGGVRGRAYPEGVVSAKRVIAHLDCDAFYATVELIKQPDLKGKPVIVAGSGPRSVVTTASYEARKFGVGSAMPASQARRLCPTAIVIAPDFTAYRETSRAVWAIVRGRLDRLQSMGLDEAYADLTGVDKPLRVLRELVTEVLEKTGIQISVGVGPNRLIAKCCSDVGKPAGFVAMGREEACIRFAPAPTRRLPGIGPKTAERLADLGYATVAQLQEADEAQLAARFGDRTARYLKARATFHDDSPVETEAGAAKSVSTERTFDTDVASHEEQLDILRTLARELAEGLQRKGRKGRTVAIKVRLADWTTVTRARTLPEATHDTALVTQTAVELLKAYAPPQPVRLLGVRLAAFDDLEPDKPPPPVAPTGQLTLAL
jgi:DNA polymerase IV